ncbi:glycosyltransferase family 2 protein [Lacticaseibacillus salsurivasis]|uniref:glycosyltransferase family 2 protein n=1 Tax=Lacticaseibacillus salsurivasis TaxID=3081441 RepID=UPI0030C6E1C7
MQESKIVICMSTYNGEKFLASQLDSFIDQDYQNWELVVHDDGSTDGTIKLIQRYQARDRRIKLIPGDGHQGIKQAFLSLLTKVEGDYYAFSDQDDVWHANKLTTLLRTLASEPSATPTLVYSRYDEIDGAGNRIPRTGRQPIYKTQLKDLLLINTVTGCTVMFNRSLRNQLIAPLASLDIEALHMHDWWAALVASALGKVIFVDQELVSYRQHGTNVLGAPGHLDFGVRLRKFLHLAESRIVHSGSRQAQQLLSCYSNQLKSQQVPLVRGVANLFEGWHPLHNFRFLKTNHLFISSKFLNIELTILLFLPPRARRRVFARND